jgi:hypothetical protein
MRRLLLPLLMLAAFVAATPASAEERTEVRSQREDAGARVRQVERSGGRVLQAEPMQRGGEEVYRIKVLTPEGRVRVIQGDDARGRDRDRDNLTDRRREFRNDQGSDVARERARERDQRLEGQRQGDPPRRDVD